MMEWMFLKKGTWNHKFVGDSMPWVPQQDLWPWWVYWSTQCDYQVIKNDCLCLPVCFEVLLTYIWQRARAAFNSTTHFLCDQLIPLTLDYCLNYWTLEKKSLCNMYISVWCGSPQLHYIFVILRSVFFRVWVKNEMVVNVLCMLEKCHLNLTVMLLVQSGGIGHSYLGQTGKLQFLGVSE